MTVGNKAYFEILRPGINTTIQDCGRNHMYHEGIAVSGAIDQRNYKLCNKLVGNDINQAVIEFAYQGPLLKLKNGRIIFCITWYWDVRMVCNRKERQRKNNQTIWCD